MKRYKFLLLAVVAALATRCYSDDTNLDYKTLDLPVIDNPDNDPALFVENGVYKVKLHDWVKITPNVAYKDMDDLSYKWIIDGEVFSTDKNLEWQCEIETPSVYGVFEIHRNSAGNSRIFSFRVELDEPQSGFCMLVEQQGQLRFDFFNGKNGQPYTFEYTANTAQELFPFTGQKPRMQEYWSCESSSVFGELMLLDEDPDNCISFDGHSLFSTIPLAKEFVEERLPDNFHVKDFMHGGFVSYLLADDGRIFPRRGARIYYTGRFMDLPLQYNGKRLKGEKFVSTKYSEGYGLVYDTTEGSGRFLIINFDYSVEPNYKAEKAGQIVAFPESSNMSGITDYEFIDGEIVLNSNSFGSDRRAAIWMLFRKKDDQKYYAREVKIGFTSSTGAIKFNEVYPEVYRELPDFGPNSTYCVIRTDGEDGGAYVPPTGYIYYTSASDPRKVLGKPRASADAPVEFHSFDSDVTVIEHGPYTRRSCYLFFATADGNAMVYITHGDYLNPTTNLATFEEDRVISTYQIEGKVRWAGYKYGNFSNFQ